MQHASFRMRGGGRVRHIYDGWRFMQRELSIKTEPSLATVEAWSGTPCPRERAPCHGDALFGPARLPTRGRPGARAPCPAASPGRRCRPEHPRDCARCGRPAERTRRANCQVAAMARASSDGKRLIVPLCRLGGHVANHHDLTFTPCQHASVSVQHRANRRASADVQHRLGVREGVRVHQGTLGRRGCVYPQIRLRAPPLPLPLPSRELGFPGGADIVTSGPMLPTSITTSTTSNASTTTIASATPPWRSQLMGREARQNGPVGRRPRGVARHRQGRLERGPSAAGPRVPKGTFLRGAGHPDAPGGHCSYSY